VQLWCGIDWAENHHDVSVVDEEGRQQVRLRIEDTAAGYSELMSMLAEQHGLCEQPISVAIETSKGLRPAALRAAGVALVAINPLAVSRYRDRLSPSRSKSDGGDAFVLANILRTDPHNHRPLPVDSELAQAIQVLARAHQDAVWDRMQITNKLRSTLREYYSIFLSAFEDLASREARATLHLASTPGEGQRIHRASLMAGLRRAGRSRGIPAAVEAIHVALRRDQLVDPSARPIDRSAEKALYGTPSPVATVSICGPREDSTTRGAMAIGPFGGQGTLYPSVLELGAGSMRCPSVPPMRGAHRHSATST
jgi:transposase